MRADYSHSPVDQQHHDVESKFVQNYHEPFDSGLSPSSRGERPEAELFEFIETEGS